MADRRGRRRGFVLVGLLAGTAVAGVWWYLRQVGTGAPVRDEWAAAVARPAARRAAEVPEPTATKTEPAVPAVPAEPAAGSTSADPSAESPASPTPLFAASTPSGSTGFAPTGDEAPPTDDTPTMAIPAVNPKEPFGPGSAVSLPDGSAPGPEYTIKGNASSMLFHTPASPYYQRTKPEAWFRSAREAEKAGFTEWKPKPRAR